ncbi:MAG: DUF2946 family protein [Pseudomonadota bacterium]
MTVWPQKKNKTARAWVAMAVLFGMLLKAVLAPLAVAAATENKADGTILVPICSGGVIQYIEIDLFAVDDGDDEAEREAPTATVVAAMDCTVLGSFVMPDSAAAGLALLTPRESTPPAAAPFLRTAAAPHLRPPMRGPPSLP